MPERAAVHSLDHFEFSVPDLAEAHRFYDAFGLEVEDCGEHLLLRTAGSDHIWARLVKGDRKRLLALDFAIDADNLDTFRARLSVSDGNNLSTVTPDGVAVRISVALKTTPDEKSSFAVANLAEDKLRGARPRSRENKIRPRRLAHIALFVTDVQQSIEFFETTLGLRLSDRSGNDVAFMHAPHGSDHHLVAMVRSDGPGLHHCSWDVGTLAEVGLGGMQMAESGYARGWGLGRHVLGSNYFHYVRDPWGSYCEYSADMDFIPADLHWVAKDHPGEDSFYQWGPTPPEDFIVNYELSK